ncbi:MAG: dihydroneopterin aldolase [Clostridia bacterium]|jgi:dihydroneopterin aldolase|nr:dihydroneopterin aldolase [Clostridia bacterium]MDD4571184.1 dihydroneopterin aldolase [Clostridia bacterium]
MVYEDKIILPAMHFMAAHGVYEQEKYVPQLFGVYVEMLVDTFQAGESDDLADSIDYSKVYEKVNEIMNGEHCALLEHLAAKIAKAVLTDERIKEVMVQVEKSMADMGTAKVPAVIKITRKAKDYEK